MRGDENKKTPIEPWVDVVASEFHSQVEELLFRARTTIGGLNSRLRTKILAEAQALLDEIGRDDTALDGDALINDNMSDGYWVTCRIFVRYPDKEDS